MTGGRILALCGGVGGAKLAHGLAVTVPADKLSIMVNTGDDFEHLGLHISPDVDTVLYTLSGRANKTLGWGRGDETWSFHETLGELGLETWFRLGDRDLALHVERTRQLRSGVSLSDATAALATRLGVGPRILPMSDQRLSTVVHTASGPLAFQEYFVREGCAPVVEALTYWGAEAAAPSPKALDLLNDDGLEAVVICPSNPFLSIAPMLAMPSFRDALAKCRAPVVAVSPLVGGDAVKGPLAKIMHELGLPRTQRSLVEYYGDLVDCWVVDNSDAVEARGIPLPVLVAKTVMHDEASRAHLAAEVLDFVLSLPRGGGET
ncbi:2-phospho-L-lactate transferase [Limibacillus sp. MBR-115]|jgi:LPPG:FO 2-phospho-L-lactate transferase|uniref:2-phospho-L-lactate transferase n=1 Tax=Limibacillus sp. MBR-115 TaxID=3156465 RepID=UPI0033993961